jgi:hypothetical protein
MVGMAVCSSPPLCSKLPELYIVAMQEVRIARLSMSCLPIPYCLSFDVLPHSSSTGERNDHVAGIAAGHLWLRHLISHSIHSHANKLNERSR